MVGIFLDFSVSLVVKPRFLEMIDVSSLPMIVMQLLGFDDLNRVYCV